MAHKTKGPDVDPSAGENVECGKEIHFKRKQLAVLAGYLRGEGFGVGGQGV